MKKTRKPTTRAWYHLFALLPGGFLLMVSIYMFHRMFLFLSVYGFWELLFGFAMSFLSLLPTWALLGSITCISVNDTGIREWRLFRHKRMTWQEVREAGLYCYPSRFGYPGYPELWRESACLYFSDRPLMDAERVGYRSYKNCISFPYCSTFNPSSRKDRRLREAIVAYYPGALPFPFHAMTQYVWPVYVIRTENTDGSFTETNGAIPDPAEVYSRIFNED